VSNVYCFFFWDKITNYSGVIDHSAAFRQGRYRSTVGGKQKSGALLKGDRTFISMILYGNRNQIRKIG